MIALSLPIPGVAYHDDGRPLTTGDTLRVRTYTNRVFVGCLDSISSDALVVSEMDDPRREMQQIPLTEVNSIRRYTGKQRNWLWGFVIGEVTGMALGLAIAAAEPAGDSTTDTIDRAFDIFYAPIVGGFYGMLVGGSIGWFVKSDQWVDVRVPKQELSSRPGFRLQWSF
jgi:hypothetical protein